MAHVCEKCHAFKQFGSKCWFFWQEKKSCSQHRVHAEADPSYKSVDVPISQLRH